MENVEINLEEKAFGGLFKIFEAQEEGVRNLFKEIDVITCLLHLHDVSDDVELDENLVIAAVMKIAVAAGLKDPIIELVEGVIVVDCVRLVSWLDCDNSVELVKNLFDFCHYLASKQKLMDDLTVGACWEHLAKDVEQTQKDKGLIRLAVNKIAVAAGLREPKIEVIENEVVVIDGKQLDSWVDCEDVEDFVHLTFDFCHELAFDQGLVGNIISRNIFHFNTEGEKYYFSVSTAIEFIKLITDAAGLDKPTINVIKGVGVKINGKLLEVNLEGNHYGNFVQVTMDFCRQLAAEKV